MEISKIRTILKDFLELLKFINPKHKNSMSFKKSWIKKAWKELVNKHGKKKLSKFEHINYV